MPWVFFIFLLKSTHLAKKLTVNEGAGYQDIILGIAADVRSWKLCYELNLILGINLKNTPSEPQVSDVLAPSPLQQQLDLPTPAFTQEYFEDLDSQAQTEFVLCSKDPKKLPPESRPFRFFLLIRSNSATPPETDVMIRRLMKVDVIHSVVNFSDHKHLQHLLP